MFNRKNAVKLELNYRGFTKIEGSDFLVSPLASEENGFKGRINYIAHNYLFLNIRDFSTSWLFASNNQIISSFYQIPLENSQLIKETIYQEKFQPFRDDKLDSEEINKKGWLLFVFTKEETTQNKKTIALSDVSGNNLVEIINDVELVYDKVRVSKDSMVLMYRSNEKILVSEIILSEKKVVKTKELPKTNE